MTQIKAILNRLESLSESGVYVAGSLSASTDTRLALCLALDRALVQENCNPQVYIELARSAALAGDISWSEVMILRERLHDAQRRLSALGMTPKWQTPPLHELEDLWLQLDEEMKEQAWQRRTAAYQHRPSFIPANILNRICGELVTIQDKLLLERAGVGADQRHVAQRTDMVRYFTGTEDLLIQEAPGLALLIQWLLHRSVDQLGLDGLFPPQSVMLARYVGPSRGYAAHMDNPGRDQDNGRRCTLTMYVNAPDSPCRGGAFALWEAGRPTSETATAVFEATPGSAILFDSREIAHEVQPLEEGPARWALTLWFQELPQQPRLPPPKVLDDTRLLLPLRDIPSDKILLHQLDNQSVPGQVRVIPRVKGKPRVGLVTTIYSRGADLVGMCGEHFRTGFDHIVLVFDHMEEPAEATAAQHLRKQFPKAQLTILASSELAKRYDELGEDPRLTVCRKHAKRGKGSHAHASRQKLNASLVLQMAKGDVLGGKPLDWLVHLDGDERLYFEGNHRGGSNLHESFASMEAAGLELVRFINHEQLGKGQFKLNPRLAAARLGERGWQETVDLLGLAQDGERPWFTGYFNGKSAVRVAAGALAAGVHGWFLETAAGAHNSAFLAGPHVLHYHVSTPESFRAKFLALANSDEVTDDLFAPSPVEERTLALIRSCRDAGDSEQAIEKKLKDLHHRLTLYDEREMGLLKEAGLLFALDL